MPSKHQAMGIGDWVVAVYIKVHVCCMYLNVRGTLRLQLNTLPVNYLSARSLLLEVAEAKALRYSTEPAALKYFTY